MSKNQNGAVSSSLDQRDLSELPEAWHWTTLGELAHVGTGTTSKRGNTDFWGNGTIPWVTSSAVNQPFVDKGSELVTQTALDETSLKYYPKDTLIIALYGEGKTRGKVSELRIEATINQALAAVVFNDETKDFRKFVKWFLHSNYVEMRRQAAGGMQPNLNLSLVKNLDVPIAPLPEQKRIVAKIEELFSDLDAGVSALERARASVLKSAVEGRLTQKWRKANKTNPGVEPASELLARILRERRHRWEQQQLATYESKGKKPPKNWQSKYKDPAVPDQRNLPEVPEGWAVASMDQLTEIITSGSRAWSKYYGSGTGTFIMAQNVRPGRLDLNFRQPVDPPDGDRDRIRSQVELGDLLVTIVGANTGDVCRVPEELPEHYVCQSVALMRPVDVSISKYLETYFVADEGAQKQFEKYIYGAGRPHLSFDQLKMTAILLPPLKEQHAILEASDSRFPSIDHTDAMLKANMAKADRLRQSILKSAFEGNLTAACLNGEMSG